MIRDMSQYRKIGVNMKLLKDKKEVNRKQTSESLRLGVILALAGGFMDAYSYLCRGNVFANAQTGNILLLGVNLVQNNWSGVFYYFCPIISFTCGIIVTEVVRHLVKNSNNMHWRQVAVLVEALILFGVSFFSQEHNLAANSLTSFACGIQVESFRTIRGSSIATTMCIGNLRSGTQYMCDFILGKKKEALPKSLLYYGIIFCFMIGAILGAASIGAFAENAIRICSVILLVAAGMMFLEHV